MFLWQPLLVKPHPSINYTNKNYHIKKLKCSRTCLTYSLSSVSYISLALMYIIIENIMYAWTLYICIVVNGINEQWWLQYEHASSSLVDHKSIIYKYICRSILKYVNTATKPP